MATQTIVVHGLEPIRSGIRSSGPWALYSVNATDEHGAPIDQKLVTYTPFPLGVQIEVELRRSEHPKYGLSYYVTNPGRGRGLGRTFRQKVVDLEERVLRLESALAAMKDGHV